MSAMKIGQQLVALCEAGKNLEAVDQLYAEVESLGGTRWDTSSLLARLEARRRRS